MELICMGWNRCEKRAGRIFLAVGYGGKLLNSLHCTDGDRGRVVEISPRVSNFFVSIPGGGSIMCSKRGAGQCCW